MAQGNRLVGRETLDATLAAFANDADRELAERLLLALEAGESTGGHQGRLVGRQGAFCAATARGADQAAVYAVLTVV